MLGLVLGIFAGLIILGLIAHHGLTVFAEHIAEDIRENPDEHNH